MHDDSCFARAQYSVIEIGWANVELALYLYFGYADHLIWAGASKYQWLLSSFRTTNLVTFPLMVSMFNPTKSLLPNKKIAPVY